MLQERELCLCATIVVLTPFQAQKQRQLSRLKIWAFKKDLYTQEGFFNLFYTRGIGLLCVVPSHRKCKTYSCHWKTESSFWTISCISSFLNNIMILRCFGVYFIMPRISKLYLFSYMLDKNCPGWFSLPAFTVLILQDVFIFSILQLGKTSFLL